MAHSRAHDVVREAEVLDRLRNTVVPAPVVAGTCRDESVTGAPFFVMDHIEGHVLRDPGSVRSAVPTEKRAALAAQLVRALVDLHAVDPREVGWGILADRDDYLTRQLKRWSSNWENDRVRVLDDLGRTHVHLLQKAPKQRLGRIVHGDFRLDNCVSAPTVTSLESWTGN